MIHVQYGSQNYPLKEGTTLLQFARQVQPAGELPFLAALMNNKDYDWRTPLKDGAQIRFLNYNTRLGFQAYQRSALLMLIKAFYSVVKTENVKDLKVLFALSDGLFLRPEGNFVLDEALLERITRKMQKYAREKYPFIKKKISSETAAGIFKDYRMHEKSRLFHYYLGSTVSVYSLGHFDDYFFGNMVPDASFIDCFKLQLYEDGFLLRIPKRNQKEKGIQEIWNPPAKLFQTLKESVSWSKKLEVGSVAALNDAITQGRINELILIQEALQEKKIAQIAEQIAQKKSRIVLIAGPSSSGKTSFANRLAIQLKAMGYRPHSISTDDYYVDREKSPRHPDGSYNFDCLECLDVDFFSQQMLDLLEGKKAEVPEYNFITGKREFNGRSLQLQADDVLIIEGIFGLNEGLTYRLPQECCFRIYISALGQFNLDEHNYISSTDGRLLRRIVRDNRGRNASALQTIRGWESVRKGEEENIFPFQENADVMFNSTSVYELGVLKKYAQALLFQIPETEPEYTEALRLLRFLDLFLGIDNDLIPRNSLVREFVGGSCFKV